MLGEKLGESRGKSTGNRVLSADLEAPKLESSFEDSGTLLGVEVSEFGTYTGVQRPGGFLQGEGQGIVMTKEGETVTWVGHGIGRFSGPGSVSWRGSFLYRTSSERLARLNGMVGLFEYEIDPEGNTVGKVWE